MKNLSEKELSMIYGAGNCYCYSGMVWPFHHKVSDQPLPNDVVWGMIKSRSAGAADINENDGWHCFINSVIDASNGAACAHYCCDNSVKSQDWVFGGTAGGRC